MQTKAFFRCASLTYLALNRKLTVTVQFVNGLVTRHNEILNKHIFVSL